VALGFGIVFKVRTKKFFLLKELSRFNTRTPVGECVEISQIFNQ